MSLPVGTLVNVAAVLIGGGAGLVLNDRLPARVKSMVFQGLGLCTLAIGMSMALEMANPVAVIFSVVFGGIIGAALKLEEKFEHFGDWLKAKVKSKNEHFTDGMVTAFLIFCVGSLTILGAFDEGLRQDPTLLFTKAMLDGFASIALAATYGIGVLFSVAPMFAYQYGLTLSAGALQGFFTEPMIAQLTATGGVLILGIGVNLLDLKRIPLTNLLPALVIAVLLEAVIG